MPRPARGPHPRRQTTGSPSTRTPSDPHGRAHQRWSPWRTRSRRRIPRGCQVAGTGAGHEYLCHLFPLPVRTEVEWLNHNIWQHIAATNSNSELPKAKPEKA